MKIAKYIVSGLLILILFGCKNRNSEPEIIEIPAKANQQYDDGRIEAKFKNPIYSEIFALYIELKTALVNSDAQKTALAASKLAKKEGIDDKLKIKVKEIAAITDIKKQRRIFSELTPILSEIINESISHGKVYKQYCPMAFNNEGAEWLSEQPSIYNPYFGSIMLRCGVVTDTLTLK